MEFQKIVAVKTEGCAGSFFFSLHSISIPIPFHAPVASGMKRISFNGGELFLELAMRADLDVYHRGARVLINWDVSQTGSLRRRRGMQPFAEAMERSRLVPYVYSNTGKERYLIEAGDDALRVLDPDSGTELARFAADWGDAESLRWKQVNNLLFFTHPASPPQVLKRADGKWGFERFRFKVMPWRYNGYRDEPILLMGLADGGYSVVFPDSLPEVERLMEDGDLLRASYYTEQQEAFAYRAALLSGIQKPGPLTRSSVFTAGRGWLRKSNIVRGTFSVNNFFTFLNDHGKQ